MKKWYEAKTLWVNIIAIVAFIVQGTTGHELDAATQGIILAAINMILRLITKHQIIWKDEEE